MNNDEKVKDYYEAAILINPKYISAFADYSKYLLDRNEHAEAQRKLRKALKADDSNPLLLNLLFYVSYILVKENLCEYNVKEAITIADKIININPDLFEYPEQKLNWKSFCRITQKENKIEKSNSSKIWRYIGCRYR